MDVEGASRPRGNLVYIGLFRIRSDVKATQR
jgi:hypothetical protein